METRTDILNELISISPLIAGIKKANVFTVPQGYFNSISDTILLCLSEANVNNQLIEKSEKQSTDIPAGYFDHLATAILDKIKLGETASNEIKNLSPLLHAIQNKNVFEVPGGYFDSIDKIIQGKIKTGSAKEEIKAHSAVLSGIQNKTVFEVPTGYFNGLAENILKRIQTPATKIISMRTRSLFIKYAVAAMMTGVLALGLYKYMEKPVSVVPNGNSVAALDAAIEKGKNMNDQQFNETLDNLSETDIAKYLEKNEDITDIAVLGNSIEVSNLPSQEDYLLDETTLDNYLKEIEHTTLNN